MKILFVYNHKAPFIKKDLDFLREKYVVTPFYFKDEGSILKHFVAEHDVVFSWFASYHTAVAFHYAKKFNKRKIVIVGGYDASDIKGYGMFDGFIKKRIVTSVYKEADSIVPVDKSLKDMIVKYLPEMESKITVVPTGYDSDYFRPKGEKREQVLMVCAVNKTNLWRKGISTYVKVAEMLPKTTFFLVGDKQIDIKHPQNMVVTGWLDDDSLLNCYQTSKVFCLLSKYEGLPNVLCEAMLCGCFPVTTCVCGIPSAQGDSGFYVPYGNVHETVFAVRVALKLDSNTDGIRNRIKDRFTMEAREKKLMELIG